MHFFLSISFLCWIADFGICFGANLYLLWLILFSSGLLHNVQRHFRMWGLPEKLSTITWGRNCVCILQNCWGLPAFRVQKNQQQKPKKALAARQCVTHCYRALYHITAVCFRFSFAFVNRRHMNSFARRAKAVLNSSKKVSAAAAEQWQSPANGIDIIYTQFTFI